VNVVMNSRVPINAGFFWVAGDLFGPTGASCPSQHGPGRKLKIVT
jgi:hypothetical protein